MKLPIVLFLFLFVTSVAAGPSVKVLALFPDKAMLEIDGQRKVLAAGATGPGGVRLISADPRVAVVEIDGQREELRLGSSVSATYKQVERQETRILKDQRGAYFIDGLVNGQPIRFLVDTGATSIAMSERHAESLGISHRIDGRKIGVRTASGVAAAHEVMLNSISVAGLRLNDVRAVVIDGDSPHYVLLGMSILKRFEMDQRENLLILRTKF